MKCCLYCSWFTGNDDTGCAGRLANGQYGCCRSFDLDRITTPPGIAAEIEAEDEW